MAASSKGKEKDGRSLEAQVRNEALLGAKKR